MRIARGVLLVLASCAAEVPAPATPGAPGADPPDAVEPIASGEASEVSPAGATDPGAASPAGPPPAGRPPGPLTQDEIRAVVRASYDQMTQCYLAGLERDPALGGTIDVHLAIDGEGEVVGASAPKGVAKRGDERLLDAGVVDCVEQVFRKLSFPATGRGMVTLTYPVAFHRE